MSLRNFVSFLLTSVAAGLAAAFAILTITPELLQLAPRESSTELDQGQSSRGAYLQSGPVSYARSVARAAPSVVNIFTTKVTTNHKLEPIDDPVLQRYYGKRYSLQPRQQLQSSLGSGVIVSGQGYLLTNNHIIEGADAIEVVLASGKNVPVRVVGSDPESDLAVLKIESSERFPAIPLGSSKSLQVGDVVLAIGNPFGVGQTVTMGIVSATGRSQLGINTYENFIQTDAAINPGNSGGALINATGELVGINTAIFSQSGGSQGIGFAIPTALAEGVMKQIIRQGQVVRGWLGITGQDVTPELAESFGLSLVEGVLVSKVLKDGPADRAGIWPGDVITRIDGITPMDMHDVLNIIANKQPGARMRVEGWRGNEKLNVYAVITRRPAQLNRPVRRQRLN